MAAAAWRGGAGKEGGTAARPGEHGGSPLRTHGGAGHLSGSFLDRHVLDVIVEVAGTDDLEAGLGSPGVDELRWLKPVYPGDRITVHGRIVDKTPSRSKPEIGSVRTETTVTNQDQVPVMRFMSIVLMRRKPDSGMGDG